MCRKIFIAALLCLLFQSVSYSQTVYPTAAQALCNPSTGATYVRADIIRLIPSNLNSDPFRTEKHYVAWFFGYNVSGTTFSISLVNRRVFSLFLLNLLNLLRSIQYQLPRVENIHHRLMRPILFRVNIVN